mgnify:CR=1 FL=1
MRSLVAVALVLGIVLLGLVFFASGDGGVFSDSLPVLFIGGSVLGVALNPGVLFLRAAPR